MRDAEDLERSFVHQIKHNIGWEDIKWIKENTYLKIILKGVMSPDDIEMAEKCKVDAIWISNHGGRQLDTAPATILAVPPIRAKIKGKNVLI